MRLVRSLLLASILIGSVALLAAIGWPASDYRHNDFFQFWAGPHALLENASPYDIDWSRDFHVRYPSRDIERSPLPSNASPYPLWTQVLLLPLALLPFEIAAPTWLVAQIFAVALGVAATRAAILRAAPERDATLLAGLAFAFEPAWLTIGGGNVSGFLFALLAGSLAAALARRPRVAGALAAFLVVKPQGALLSIAALVAGIGRARWRFVAAASLVAVALAVMAFVVRPGWIADWARNAAALQSSTGSNATGWTLDRAVPLGPLVPIAAEAFVAGVWLLWIRFRRPELSLLVGGTVPISLFVAPHGWSYDQLPLLITAALILERLAGLDDARRLAGVIGLFAFLGVLPWFLYALAASRGGEEWSALTPVLAFALLVAADALSGAGRRAVRPSLA